MCNVHICMSHCKVLHHPAFGCQHLPSFGDIYKLPLKSLVSEEHEAKQIPVVILHLSEQFDLAYENFQESWNNQAKSENCILCVTEKGFFFPQDITSKI